MAKHGFSNSSHPRDSHGRFASKSGGRPSIAAGRKKMSAGGEVKVLNPKRGNRNPIYQKKGKQMGIAKEAAMLKAGGKIQRAKKATAFGAYMGSAGSATGGSQRTKFKARSAGSASSHPLTPKAVRRRLSPTGSGKAKKRHQGVLKFRASFGGRGPSKRTYQLARTGRRQGKIGGVRPRRLSSRGKAFLQGRIGPRG